MWRQFKIRREECQTASARDVTEHPAGALDTFESPTPRADLQALSLMELSTELLARLASGQTYQRGKELVLAGQLQNLLESRLDVHLNRFARRRLYDVVRPILDRLPPPELQGGTVVELGSGSLNPFVVAFLFLMLGARRAYAIDLEPVQDLERAVRALATAAGWLLIDPTRITGPHTIAAASVLQHLTGFDLPKLAAGDPDGIAFDRLIYNIESIYDLSLDDGEADLVSSVSLLEHVDRIEDALESLRHVTRPGGIGHHVVDFIDHRVYGEQVQSPFDFLAIDTPDAIVHGCNRIRYGQLCMLFQQHGFAVEHVEACRTEPLTNEEQRRFVEPFRSMPRDDLTMMCARIFVRRR